LRPGTRDRRARPAGDRVDDDGEGHAQEYE
jgi:hypothetical protein